MHLTLEAERVQLHRVCYPNRRVSSHPTFLLLIISYVKLVAANGMLFQVTECEHKTSMYTTWRTRYCALLRTILEQVFAEELQITMDSVGDLTQTWLSSIPPSEVTSSNWCWLSYKYRTVRHGFTTSLESSKLFDHHLCDRLIPAFRKRGGHLIICCKY